MPTAVVPPLVGLPGGELAMTGTKVPHPSQHGAGRKVKVGSIGLVLVFSCLEARAHGLCCTGGTGIDRSGASSSELPCRVFPRDCSMYSCMSRVAEPTVSKRARGSWNAD